jgi:carboxypeptidase family protein
MLLNFKTGSVRFAGILFMLNTARAATTMHVLGAILGVLLFSVALFAQGSFGRILGTVTDQTGAVLAGATVSITDTERGLARTLTTDSAGEYNAPNLIPSTYTVRVEAKGFKVLDRQNVVLEVGREIRVDLTPQPGAQNQTVTVTESIPLVDTASATLGGVLNNADINDLPLNGRNYQSLMSLRPGVVVQPGGGPWTQSTNGIRPDETAWMVEGVINATMDAARPIANMSSPLTDAATILPVDAIQEFNMQENPKAEYGWKPGAVVNVGIRSGTNTPHGSAYAFGRDQDWDARNLFNPAPNDKLPTTLEQFGGVAGFRIKKDKLFFFGGYEGMRSTVGNPSATNIPETGPGGGPANSMVDAINALQKAGVALSPVSLKLLGCTAAGSVSCTGGLFQNAPAAGTTSLIVAFPNINVSDNEIGKIDYRINDKNMLNTMFWSGNYNGTGQDHGGVNEMFEDIFHIRAVTSVTSWIWTPSSTVVNEARFATTRNTFNQTPIDAGVRADGSGGLCTATGCGGKGYPINTGVTSSIFGGLPNINITGYTFLGTFHNRPSYVGPSPYYVYQDSVSFLRGKHALKVGGEFTHIVANASGGDTGRGRIDFQGNRAFAGSTPLEDFFAGTPSRGFLLAGDSVREYDWRSYSAFVQDDWRIKPRLMVNLGLRYEYQTPIREANNLWGNFDPNSPTGLVQQGSPSVGDSLWKPNNKNFSPRLGIAWDITGKGTTVIRAGASVIYSTLIQGQFGNQLNFQNTHSTQLSAVPTGACKTPVVIGVPCPQTLGGTIQLGSAAYPAKNLTWNGVVFPQGGGLSCTASSPCVIGAVDPNLKTPRILSWNFGVQHAISNNLSLEVGYVGNHGSRLTGYVDVNQCAPNANGNCVRPYGTAFPYLQFIDRQSNQAYSNYNSLQTTLTKRLSQGLSFTAGYTYGHGLDNGSISRFGYLPQNANNPGAEYASGDFDIRHRLTLTATYALPGKKGFGQLLEGWKINSILTIHTPQPWNLTDLQNDFSGAGDNSDRWDFFGNTEDFRSSSSSIPYCASAKDCSVTSGVSGIQTQFSPSQSAAMWGQCLAVSPDKSTLATGGCYVKGSSVMVPPKAGTFGTMGRNMFRDSGFKNLDFSLFKDFKFKERFNAQFRVEMFNIFNWPLVANPWGSQNGWGGGSDAGGSPTTFGCGCATSDVAAGNPLIGSGGSRDIQLGFKFTF